MNQLRSIILCRSTWVLLGCMVLGLWIYWPGHAGPELLDDRSSLQKLMVLEQQPELASDFIFSDKSGPLGRPVSLGSFVVEKLVYPGGLDRSKQVNILLHLVNACLVAILFSGMFSFIGVRRHRSLAVALATLWLFSPIYISTVLYAVQRMAMLATTFMLLAVTIDIKVAQAYYLRIRNCTVFSNITIE